MSTFLEALQNESSKNAFTENGALTHSSTGDEVLNFFALAGAMRNNHRDAIKLFRKAFQEDKQLAVRALFYLRDVRGGQGERDLFRVLYAELRELDSALADKLVVFAPVYGRWDDLIEIAPNPETVKGIIGGQLASDEDAMAKGLSVSLMAKWLPSENASSKASRAKARKLAELLGMSNKEYRQRVVALRKHIGLLEQSMSQNEWTGIDYGKLPSQASRKHIKAFKRHDEYRFEEFLDAVLNGEKTMNAGTTFTYEVLDVVRKGDDKAANAIWKSLPDYTNGSNALVVADVSGSMGSIHAGYGYGNGQTQPIDVSVSLALYFAEHNSGPFKDYFVTFSSRPELVKVTGRTLTEKLVNISNANWGFNTDIQAVFDLVLKAAKAAGANAEDIPRVLYIVSDMEFDSVSGGQNVTNYEAAKAKFEAAGFQLPHVVFWNVAARNTNVPTTAAATNVTLVSGLSQSTFRYVLEGKTPKESMLDILNGERYAQITV